MRLIRIFEPALFQLSIISHFWFLMYFALLCPDIFN